MHETKFRLLEKNGCKCMLCGREVPYKEINWHHIFPKYMSAIRGESDDNSYENGSLVCVKCHRKIHVYRWWDKEYQDMMQIILQHKR